MSAISDIDICYSDIGEKYVGLKTVIPIFASEFILISDMKEKKLLSPIGFEPVRLKMVKKRYNTDLNCLSIEMGMSEIGYRISDKTYSDIRHNVGLSSLSPISEVSISGSIRYR
jgi:hypothetical protein